MNKYKIANILAALSVIGIVYCVIAFLYIQPRLTPETTTLPQLIRTLGNITLPIYILLGIYHLVLLVSALKLFVDKVKGTFFHSFYVVVLILSGITLCSDITLLSDIGKEYRFWDVTSQWWMLYGFMSVHLVVVIYGTISRVKNHGKGQPLFEAIRTGNDTLFVGMNQIGFVCALIGIAGVFSSRIKAITQPYQTGYMLLLSGLAIAPLVSFFIYWAIRNRGKPASTWFDEKQISDTSFGALIALCVCLPLLVLLTAGSMIFTTLPAPFWLILTFFITLGVFSGAVILRNRMSNLIDEPDEI